MPRTPSRDAAVSLRPSAERPLVRRRAPRRPLQGLCGPLGCASLSLLAAGHPPTSGAGHCPQGPILPGAGVCGCAAARGTRPTEEKGRKLRSEAAVAAGSLPSVLTRGVPSAPRSRSGAPHTRKRPVCANTCKSHIHRLTLCFPDCAECLRVCESVSSARDHVLPENSPRLLSVPPTALLHTEGVRPAFPSLSFLVFL